MLKTDSNILKRLAWPTYCVAFLLVALPALDYVTNVWPIRLGEVQWRYGSAGLLTAYMLTPLLGVMFALGAALVLEHRVVIRVISVVNVVVALVFLITVLFHALDVLQLRGGVPDEARSTYDTGAVKAALKYLAMAVVLAWLGIVGLRATRSRRQARRTGRADSDVPLVRPETAAKHPAKSQEEGQQ